MKDDKLTSSHVKCGKPHSGGSNMKVQAWGVGVKIKHANHWKWCCENAASEDFQRAVLLLRPRIPCLNLGISCCSLRPVPVHVQCLDGTLNSYQHVPIRVWLGAEGASLFALQVQSISGKNIVMDSTHEPVFVVSIRDGPSFHLCGMGNYGVASYCAALGQYLDELDDLVDEPYGNPRFDADFAPELGPALAASQACAGKAMTAVAIETVANTLHSGPLCPQAEAHAGADAAQYHTSGGARQSRRTVRQSPSSPLSDWLDVLLRKADLVEGLVQSPVNSVSTTARHEDGCHGGMTGSTDSCSNDAKDGSSSITLHEDRVDGAQGSAVDNMGPARPSAVQVTVLLASSASLGNCSGSGAHEDEDGDTAVAAAASATAATDLAFKAVTEARVAGNAPRIDIEARSGTVATAFPAAVATSVSGGDFRGESTYRWVTVASPRNQQLLELLGLSKTQCPSPWLSYSLDPYDWCDIQHGEECLMSVEVADVHDPCLPTDDFCFLPYAPMLPPGDVVSAADGEMSAAVRSEVAACRGSLGRQPVLETGGRRAASSVFHARSGCGLPATGGGGVEAGAALAELSLQPLPEQPVHVEVVRVAAFRGGGGPLTPHTAEWLVDTFVMDSLDGPSSGSNLRTEVTGMYSMYVSLNPYDSDEGGVYVLEGSGSPAPVFAGPVWTDGDTNASTGLGCCCWGCGKGACGTRAPAVGARHL